MPDLSLVSGRIVQIFSITLTVTNIQYGVNAGNNNPPNYCTTVVHIGDRLTLNGTGTCAGSDVHEICNQQFTLTGAGSGGNLMRVHSSYQGGSGSPIQGVSFITSALGDSQPYPATLDSYWDSSKGTPLLRTDYDSTRQYLMSPDTIASDLNPVIGSGQESQMDSNVGTAAGYEGFGIQIGIYPLDVGLSAGSPVISGTLASGAFVGVEGGDTNGPRAFGGY